MQRFLAAVLVTAAALAAAPVNCTNGTVADYSSLGSEGCAIGDIVVLPFSNPGVVPGSMELDPAAVGVMPIFDAQRPGLLFTYNAQAGPGDILESAVAFSLLSSKPLGAVTLRLLGSSASPDGVAVITTDLGAPGFLAVFDIGVDAELVDTRTIGPLTGLDILHDAVVDGGLNGSASLTGAELRFQTVPEPSAFLPVLLSLAFLIRRRR